jgi:hypothetical protein
LSEPFGIKPSALTEVMALFISHFRKAVTVDYQPTACGKQCLEGAAL